MKNMKKLIMLSCLFLVLGTVFVTGCLDGSNNSALTSVNPLNKNIEPYRPTSVFEQVSPDGDIILYKGHSNVSFVFYSNESLISESDIAFYGTLTNIGSTYWFTPGKTPPSGLYTTPVGKIIVGFENGTQIDYKQVSIPGVNDYMCTPLTFEINDMVKGKNKTTITVLMWGGQFDNYLMYDESYPDIWDLKEGQEYLVYIQSDDAGNDFIMRGGFFIVLD